MQGHEFAAQLAQFSSVEQLVNIGDALAKNGELNGLLAQSVNSGVAAGLIGKSIETKGNQINWTGEGVAELNFSLAYPAKSATITIRDAAGNTVRKFELDGRSDGEHKIEWDGLDSSEARVSEGVYNYSVDAVDATGASVEAEMVFRGKVDRITFGSDGIHLWIGRVSVAMSKVESVRE
jgi:flagellar basal-body rod modification protein FlgD